MKLNPNLELKDLSKDFGFIEINEESIEIEGLDYIIGFHLGGIYLNLGYSRRGQMYYLIITKDKKVLLYASDADGDGGTIPFPEELFQLIYDKVIIL